MRFALLGKTLGYSYSKDIHQKFGYDYDLLEVEEKDFSKVLKSGSYDGFNVTVPYKKEVIKQMEEYDLALMPYECEEENGLKKVLSSFQYKSISIFIGPEGGFESYEADMARKLGIQVCSMGNRILRCETAPIVALTALMYESGNLS